ncbi:hypothetical protein DSO57_1008604 [Entomophthora muscae]|uniref:Uncharacterized protein n=1 Tax=Entomophthora muscae TaxID=34485 RepID=A0ACC2S8R9_9FUNG|nr:hypothetical protein DSO57_1008604 [Entomophthora muscae]
MKPILAFIFTAVVCPAPVTNSSDNYQYIRSASMSDDALHQPTPGSDDEAHVPYESSAAIAKDPKEGNTSPRNQIGTNPAQFRPTLDFDTSETGRLIIGAFGHGMEVGHGFVQTVHFF